MYACAFVCIYIYRETHIHICIKTCMKCSRALTHTEVYIFGMHMDRATFPDLRGTELPGLLPEDCCAGGAEWGLTPEAGAVPTPVLWDAWLRTRTRTEGFIGFDPSFREVEGRWWMGHESHDALERKAMTRSTSSAQSAAV